MTSARICLLGDPKSSLVPIYSPCSKLLEQIPCCSKARYLYKFHNLLGTLYIIIYRFCTDYFTFMFFKKMLALEKKDLLTCHVHVVQKMFRSTSSKNYARLTTTLPLALFWFRHHSLASAIIHY